ncbi:MAG: ATP-dependent Clp protease proteolytic subunit [Patescibacteria group bacterium]
MLVPMVVEQTNQGERAFDIYSRLLRDRIIMLCTAINSDVASLVTSQLLYLESQDSKFPVWMYIQSPGGVISAGLAIIDTMNLIACPVYTVCMGSAASMGAMILACGDRGHRYILPNAEVMIHQPSGGTSGQETDIQIAAARIHRMKEKMNALLAQQTGQPEETIKRDVERDFWMTADEAKAYGMVDAILTSRSVYHSD